jgi:TPR repeat protein
MLISLAIVGLGALALLAISHRTTDEPKVLDGSYRDHSSSSTPQIGKPEAYHAAEDDSTRDSQTPTSFATDWMRALEHQTLRKKSPWLVDPGTAESQFKELSERADSGDAAAALSMFHLAESCGLVDGAGRFSNKSSRATPSCRALAIKGDSIRDYLIDAAKGREPASFVPLTGMARSMARQSPGSEDTVTIAAVTIKLLEQAASYGHAEAFVLLAQTYRDGVIVPPNEVKSYVFMDAFARGTDDVAAKRVAQELSLKLRVGDKITAEERQKELFAQIIKNHELHPR